MPWARSGCACSWHSYCSHRRHPLVGSHALSCQSPARGSEAWPRLAAQSHALLSQDSGPLRAAPGEGGASTFLKAKEAAHTLNTASPGKPRPHSLRSRVWARSGAPHKSCKPGSGDGRASGFPGRWQTAHTREGHRGHGGHVASILTRGPPGNHLDNFCKSCHLGPRPERSVPSMWGLPGGQSSS